MDKSGHEAWAARKANPMRRIERTSFLAFALLSLMNLSVITGCSGEDTDRGSGPTQEEMSDSLVLGEGWAIRSAAEVPESGETISTPLFEPESWYPTEVPSTVLAALVANEVYTDPYVGMNLRDIPGTAYPIGANFSNLPMPLDSPFRSSWWFRTEFSLPASYDGRRIYLHLKGINYRANVWFNGEQIADSANVVGTYRIHEFDVSGMALPGEANCLAVEVFPPDMRDLAITWVDWNPMPPDKDMGIWREVILTTGGPVTLGNAQVLTEVDRDHRGQEQQRRGGDWDPDRSDR
jgi:exo-1,4-beta-D-glucosaminidase